jgi:hypothetical protein
VDEYDDLVGPKRAPDKPANGDYFIDTTLPEDANVIESEQRARAVRKAKRRQKNRAELFERACERADLWDCYSHR